MPPVPLKGRLRSEQHLNSRVAFSNSSQTFSKAHIKEKALQSRSAFFMIAKRKV
jgi:hypothetical protein